jgi:putative peptidoglycan lipid II flippase
LRDAFRLIDRTLMLAAAAAVGGCALGILLREPVIALLFQRGSFTQASTHLVAAVFLGFAPSLIGWSLLELTARSMFALDKTGLPLIAAAFAVAVNLTVLAVTHAPSPTYIGVGSSAGLILAFLFLFAASRVQRKQSLEVQPEA